VARTSSTLPGLARTTRLHVKLISASYAADIPAAERERLVAEAAFLSPDDGSIGAARRRGLALSHSEWIARSRMRIGLRQRWQDLFPNRSSVCPGASMASAASAVAAAECDQAFEERGFTAVSRAIRSYTRFGSRAISSASWGRGDKPGLISTPENIKTEHGKGTWRSPPGSGPASRR
jgi:hypothetical protein